MTQSVSMIISSFQMSCSWVVLLSCMVVGLVLAVLMKMRSVVKALVSLTEARFKRALM